MAKKAFVYDGTNWIDIAQSTADLSNYAHIPSTQFSFRNKIINGDFRINQRAYTSASNLASGAYGFDRWKSTFTNTTLTFTSAPQGQTVTINSGGSVEQIIERADVPAGTYILSWTGTATGRVYNTGATPPAYAASPIVVTLDGTQNVEVEFTASGGTRTLQNVQLEAGSLRSSFEYRPIGIELNLCKRYYTNDMGNGSGITFGALASDNNRSRGVIYFTAGSGEGGFYNRFPQEMRTTPTLNIASWTTQNNNVVKGTNVTTHRPGIGDFTSTCDGIGPMGFNLFTSASGKLFFQYEASAEL